MRIEFNIKQMLVSINKFNKSNTINLIQKPVSPGTL